MPQPAEDGKYVRRCLEIALRAKGNTAPNPMVGAVIVHGNTIIGEGYHKAFGSTHAEPCAISSVKNPGLLGSSTLYVNLEPCAHYGKTPPCADLIIRSGIPRVVAGTVDPNPLVSGNGIKRLKENGIKVTAGLIEHECRHVNRRYFTWHLQKRPWIILKWAQSADGFIDLERPPGTPVGPNWITSETARILVHKWRAEEQAILVGTNTVIKDNPRLNVRLWEGRDPLRVIIDRELKLGSSYHVFDNSQDTLVFTEAGAGLNEATHQAGKVAGRIKNKAAAIGSSAGQRERQGPEYASLAFDGTAEEKMMKHLYSLNIQSVIIEGGAFTLNRFIEKGLWDEARIFTGQQSFLGGVKAPFLSGIMVKSLITGNSLLKIFYNNSSQCLPHPGSNERTLKKQ